MDNKRKEIGQRIRHARKRAKLSQAELSERLQISPSHMSDIENGKKNIGLDIFMRITEELQVSADWLLRTDVPSVNAIQNQEITEILSGCTADEVQTLLKLLRAIKEAIHKPKKKTLDEYTRFER